MPLMSAEKRTPPGAQAATSVAAVAVTELAANRLLDGLPPDEVERLRFSATRVRPRMRQLLYEQGGAMEYAYFPQNGVYSMLAQMADGAIIETLTVGNEGVVGLPLVMGATRSHTRAICQISGWAIRIPAAPLIDAAQRSSVLFDRLMRYAQAQLTSLSRSVACNRLHTAQQRYARWVLMTHDRVGTEEFPITQEFLSQMLGLTRPTVSIVGQELQAMGLIHYAQGRLTVDDRAGLEQTTCECYGAVRAAFDELLGVQRG
jgi:CRP-like cAMP-binding protein